jgi:hypothetical protein
MSRTTLAVIHQLQVVAPTIHLSPSIQTVAHLYKGDEEKRERLAGGKIQIEVIQDVYLDVDIRRQ